MRSSAKDEERDEESDEQSDEETAEEDQTNEIEGLKHVVILSENIM